MVIKVIKDAFVVFLLLNGLVLGGCSECLLDVAVSRNSSIKLSGSSTEPLVAPITLHGSPGLSLQGKLQLHLGSACPRSFEALQAALNRTVLSGTEIALLPAEVAAEVRSCSWRVRIRHHAKQPTLI